MKLPPISIITPSRNNLKYLKWSYESIKKHAPYVEYCVASDFSTDGTVKWCEEMSRVDKNFKYIVNDGTWFGKNKGTLDRMGHCRLYDILINDVSTSPIFVILHADMYISENFIENLYKHLKPGVIVSGTRIEPDIHPADYSKIQHNFGLEPNQFNSNEFIEYTKTVSSDKVTYGFFAPWMAYKSDFTDIGGHDQETFGYQSREDTDIAVRFMLNGNTLIQTWDALCYHLTMRGSRRNPNLTTTLQDSDEWLNHNKKSERNYIRKWGSFPTHDEYMLPIVYPKYDIGFVMKNTKLQHLEILEPWCSTVYTDCDNITRELYIKREQPNTKWNLSDKITNLNTPYKNDIIVTIDCDKLTEVVVQYLFSLPLIIKNDGKIGKFELTPLFIDIHKLNTYENNLIKKPLFTIK